MLEPCKSLADSLSQKALFRAFFLVLNIDEAYTASAHDMYISTSVNRQNYA